MLMRTNMRIYKCVDGCILMHIDMCMDTWIYLSIAMCTDVCINLLCRPKTVSHV